MQQPANPPVLHDYTVISNASAAVPRLLVSEPSPDPVPAPTSPQALLADTSAPPTPLTPMMPGSATCSDDTFVGTIKSGDETNSNDSLDPAILTNAERNAMTSRWIDSVSKYGPTDWLNCTFIDEDAAAAKIFGAQRHYNYSINGDVNPAARDDMTELTADRQRLPTLLRATDLGKGQRRSLMGMMAGADGRLRLGAAFRSQHGDGGPMEPTGALYNLRMRIVCNFAQQCRDAEHSAVAAPDIPPIDTAAASAPMLATGLVGPCDMAAPRPSARPLTPTPRTPPPHPQAALPTTPSTSATPPSESSKVVPICRRCARGTDFVMREQHGRLFLETVLLPLSERGTYSDMLVHVNTCVAERIFAESGMDVTGNKKAPSLSWEGTKTMPIYEDYQGALTLATHRQRVLSMLPMATDRYGLLYGEKNK
ncbi:hypothetical protein SCUCBS95973_007413 [Sporothrix curviconia]|uniref:Uncharacterized protein n=1 Tax=Sporothrix curviconia TaxID=1260050 RepID=A0ABP0CDS0_9PEZI